MSSLEDHERHKHPDPPYNLDFSPGQSNTQGSAGSNQQHRRDSSLAALEASQPTTMATTAVSQTSTTATTTVSQDTQATTTVSHPSTTATTAVSLQTTATSTESQSTLGHVTVSPSVGDASQSTSSISTAAGELEAVINQAFPESLTATPQGPVTGMSLPRIHPATPRGLLTLQLRLHSSYLLPLLTITNSRLLLRSTRKIKPPRALILQTPFPAS